MIKLNQDEKSIVSGCWCEDGNKCFPWNEVNNKKKIDFGVYRKMRVRNLAPIQFVALHQNWEKFMMAIQTQLDQIM